MNANFDFMTGHQSIFFGSTFMNIYLVINILPSKYITCLRTELTL